MDRLAAMEVFVRVVETGSFSAAARHLRVGQPAVSYRPQVNRRQCPFLQYRPHDTALELGREHPLRCNRQSEIGEHSPRVHPRRP